jgi:hypothetical protein
MMKQGNTIIIACHGRLHWLDMHAKPSKESEGYGGCLSVQEGKVHHIYRKITQW